jgi:DNA-binding cell septation regulator SpoVG
MSETIFEITEINARFEPNRPDGIIAWVSLVLNGCLFLGGIAVRKENGRIAITFPARKRDAQSMYFYHKPINAQCHEEIRKSIVKALNLD